MTLNELVNDLNEIKSRVDQKDQHTISLINDVCKNLYLHVRQLATRQDLTFWYQESSLNVLKQIDNMLENKK